MLFDDRKEVSPGFKFKDADLLGMPYQVIVGEKNLAGGQHRDQGTPDGEALDASACNDHGSSQGTRREAVVYGSPSVSHRWRMAHVGACPGGHQSRTTVRSRVTCARRPGTDIEDAIAWAVAAFRETRKLASYERMDALSAIAAGIGERKEELASNDHP